MNKDAATAEEQNDVATNDLPLEKVDALFLQISYTSPYLFFPFRL